jgi:phosphoglycerate dehydrogenase-like enzyme
MPESKPGREGTLRIGVTEDLFAPDGSSLFGDIGLGILDAPGMDWIPVGPPAGEISAEAVGPLDALLVFSPEVTIRTLSAAPRLSVVARIGVGTDNVVVSECTSRGIAVTITPDGVRRPMATSAMAFILALSHRLLIKDRLVREGKWSNSPGAMGIGLANRTLGIVGLGNIGQDLCRLATPFDMRVLAADPALSSSDALSRGAELVDLTTLFEESDFLCITCPLTTGTYHLIGDELIRRMKSAAYLVNVARGPIVDQAALTTALLEGVIAGAALDVFEAEPIDPSDPILRAPDLIVTPHSVGWTDEWARLSGASACQSIVDVFSGRIPSYLADASVVSNPEFVRRLDCYAKRSER